MPTLRCRRNPDAWTAPDAGHGRYAVTLPVQPDPTLCALVLEEIEKEVGPDRVVQGLNASADSFYSSQVRTCGATAYREQGGMCMHTCACVSAETCAF